MKTKECKKCGVSKELSDFYKRAKSKDGLRYYSMNHASREL